MVCLKGFVNQTKFIVNTTDLSVDDAELPDIAVVGRCVSGCNGVVEAADGSRSVVEIPIGAAQDIVGQHALIGCTFSVEIVGEEESEAVVLEQ